MIQTLDLVHITVYWPKMTYQSIQSWPVNRTISTYYSIIRISKKCWFEMKWFLWSELHSFSSLAIFKSFFRTVLIDSGKNLIFCKKLLYILWWYSFATNNWFVSMLSVFWYAALLTLKAKELREHLTNTARYSTVVDFTLRCLPGHEQLWSFLIRNSKWLS